MCAVLSQPEISEVIIMAEQKARPAVKKVAAARAGSRVAGKPKPAKATLTTTAKKPPAKKTVVAGPQKPKKATVKKAATPAAKKKAPAKKPQGTRIKPLDTNPKPAATGKAARPTPEERYRMVETAAYFIAERHGFQGRSDEHWAAAELEVAVRLKQQAPPRERTPSGNQEDRKSVV